MTKAEFEAFQAKHGRGGPVLTALLAPDEVNEPVPAGHELELHNDIIRECRLRGWVYIHSDPRRRPTNQPGTPDFIIGADAGRTLWVECKAEGGTLRKAQKLMGDQLVANGQLYLICTSLPQFIRWAEYAGKRCGLCGIGFMRGEVNGQKRGAALCQSCFDAK